MYQIEADVARKHAEKLSLGTHLIVAGILGGGLSCQAQQFDLPQSAARGAASVSSIHFGSTAYDFGKIEEGYVVKHDFVFTNFGRATLEILDVKPGCGCTAAGTWTKKVKPSKTGIIPIQFNSANFSGTVSKQATVICNDPDRTNVVLEINGVVWKPIDVSASMVSFILSSESKSEETRTVRSQQPEPITPIVRTEMHK